MPRKIEYEFGQTKEGTELTFLFETDPKIRNNGYKRRRGFFSCSCGNFTEAYLENWKQSHTRTCGHLQKDTVSALFKTHGLSKNLSASSYYNMLSRCYNSDDGAYPHYGGRGIKVCDRWLDSERGIFNFIEDMGDRPSNKSLDRINVNGDYTPENCRWVDAATQSYNTRRHHTNTSGRTGVYTSHYRNDDTPVYASYIYHEGKSIHLGTTTDYSIAVKRRIEAEIKYKGYEKPIEYDGKGNLR